MVSLKTAVRTRRLKSIAVRLALLCVVALLLGFASFVWRLPDKQVALDRDTDGIVVLTGGSSRVTEALELLAAKRGKRLLISGVNPGTTTADIAYENPHYDRLFACCIDLDYSAINTLGNAEQARLWAADHGFRSLIVVTSNYHMPRALAELSHQLQGIALVPYPVLSDRLRAEPWWADGKTTRVVVSEYLKFLFAEVRMRFEPAPAGPDGNRVSDARHL